MENVGCIHEYYFTSTLRYKIFHLLLKQGIKSKQGISLHLLHYSKNVINNKLNLQHSDRTFVPYAFNHHN